ncbi:MAG: class I SAM-dependent methyltransferase [Bacteroidota bacterium]
MKSKLARLGDKQFFALCGSLLGLALVVGVIEKSFLPSTTPMLFHLSLVFGLMLTIWVLSLRNEEKRQKLRKQIRGDYQNVEALFSLYQQINPRLPLPIMRGWAASPDFLNVLVELVRTRKPKVIVECGSGTSSLVSGYLLEELGQGKVYSLDHEAYYGAETTQRLALHGLSEQVEVFHAPLIQHQIEGKSWQWYDFSALPAEVRIDLLVIDGPPSSIQHQARYPALPLLAGRMSAEATILLDDYDRPEDTALVKRWVAEFEGWTLKEIGTEKGAAVLTKK